MTKKSYNVEMIYASGTPVESDSYDEFDTLQEAVDFINRQNRQTLSLSKIWLNGERCSFKDYVGLVGSDGEPFCTNPKWHELFAPPGYPRVFPKGAAA